MWRSERQSGRARGGGLSWICIAGTQQWASVREKCIYVYPYRGGQHLRKQERNLSLSWGEPARVEEKMHEAAEISAGRPLQPLETLQIELIPG